MWFICQDMDILSALLFTDDYEFPLQNRLSVNFDVFIDINTKNIVSKQSGCHWWDAVKLLYDCSLNRLFRRRSKIISQPRVPGFFAGNSPRTGEFPAQMASNAEMFPFDDVIMASM